MSPRDVSPYLFRLLGCLTRQICIQVFPSISKLFQVNLPLLLHIIHNTHLEFPLLRMQHLHVSRVPCPPHVQAYDLLQWCQAYSINHWSNLKTDEHVSRVSSPPFSSQQWRTCLSSFLASFEESSLKFMSLEFPCLPDVLKNKSLEFPHLFSIDPCYPRAHSASSTL